MFNMGYIVFIFIVYLLLLALASYLMMEVADKKGYHSQGKIFAICFFLGIFGFLYVIALPDRILQEQNEKLLQYLQKNSSDGISKSVQTSIYNDLPTL